MSYHQHTLYDDWRSRRDELSADTKDDEVARLHVQLLDYLLERYQGSDVARQPARPPALKTVGVNERAIVVHHHIEDFGSGVSNASQAKSRVSSVLHRLQAHSTGSATATDDPQESPPPTKPRASGKLWDKIRRRIGWGFRPDKLMERALEDSPYLPASALQHLFQRIADRTRSDLRATEMLLRCENRSVYDLVARAWRERAVADCHDQIFERLEEFFLDARHAQQKRGRIRLELADERAEVRSAALGILQRIGTLEDISLLSDLLSLLTQDDQYEIERRELVQTMSSISRKVEG